MTAMLLLVLLGLVAFASSSGLGHAAQSQPTPGYVSWAMSIFLVIFVLMIPVAIYIYFFQGREEFLARKAKEQSFALRVARKLAVLAFIFLIFAAAGVHGEALGPPELLPPPVGDRSRLPAARSWPRRAAATTRASSGRCSTSRSVLLALLAGWLWLKRRTELAAYAASCPSSPRRRTSPRRSPTRSTTSRRSRTHDGP